MKNTNKVVLADCISVAAVAFVSGAVCAVLFWMGEVSQPVMVWLIALPFLCGGCLWIWHVSNELSFWDREKWGYALVFTPLIGAISFAIDVLIGSSNGHYKSFIEAASHAGSPFGFPLTVLICPVGTLVALGSWIRCLILRPSDPES